MSSVLRLSGEEYFEDPWKNLSEVVETEPGRLTIDMPPRLACDRNQIPLHVLEIGEDLHLYSVKRSGIAVLVNQSNGQIRTALTRVTPPPPQSFATFDIQRTTIDLRSLFAIPRTEERYTAGLMAGPYRSGPLPLELGPPATVWSDPAVAEFLRSRRGRLGARPIAATVHSVRWIESRPEMFAEPSAAKSFIEMRAPRVVLASETPEAILNVRFRLPVHKFDVFTAAESRGWVSGIEMPPQRRPIAGVPISLVIIDSFNGAPYVIHLQAPIYRDLESQGEALVGEGGFALNLFNVGEIDSRPRTYFIYAVSGLHIEGPALFAVVDETLL
jgi:hypothetical protein